MTAALNDTGVTETFERGRGLRLPVRPWHVLIAAGFLVYPFLVPDFWRLQIGAYPLALGTIALSLSFLAGYGGMVSLAQMTVAGFAGYMVGIFGTASGGHGLGWPWWAYLPVAIAAPVAMAAAIGWIAVRTAGIYTIMITLAIAVAVYYLARQNYDIFNGFNGFAGLLPPDLFGVDWRSPLPFYFLALGVAAICYFAVVYVSRSTFGIALQAIRDNPRRMSAIGFAVRAHRVAAYAFAGLIAALGGILLVWFNGRISPETIGVGNAIDILVIAVLGGLGHPIGAFLGAILFVLLENFAIDLIDADRFNTVIGLVFLLVILFSPDGILGLLGRLKLRRRAREDGL